MCPLRSTNGVLSVNGTSTAPGEISRVRVALLKWIALAATPVLAAFLTELARWSGRADGGAQEDNITLIAVDFEQIPSLAWSDRPRILCQVLFDRFPITLTPVWVIDRQLPGWQSCD